MKNMEENKLGSLQHVQLPNNMTATKELTPKDLLIYVCIKKFMNGKTKECYPSQETLMKLSGVTKPTLKKSIDKLVELQYISVRKEGRKNVYRFSSHKNFEPFSYAFLDKEDLSPGEKSVVIVEQQFMIKDEEGIGKITYTDHKLADKINMSYNTLAKYHKSLEEKGYLTVVKTRAKDSETGLMINEKIFHLNELEQAIVFTLQNHEDRIGKTEKKVDNTEKQMNILIKEVDRMSKELRYYKEKESNDNCTITLN